MTFGHRPFLFPWLLLRAATTDAATPTIPEAFRLHEAIGGGDAAALEALLKAGQHDVDASFTVPELVDAVAGEASMERDAAVSFVHRSAPLQPIFFVALGAPLMLTTARYTPLALAAAIADDAAVDLLLEHGAQLHKEGSVSPLHLAIRSEVPPVSAAKKMTEQAVQSMATVMVGTISASAGSSQMKAMLHRDKKAKIVTKLLEKGASPSVITPELNASTPLHAASVLYGSFDDLGKRLIEAGAAVDAPDANGRTPFHYACGHLWKHFEEFATRHERTLEMLLAHGADINARDASQALRSTPLAVTVRGLARGYPAYMKHIEVLVRHGAGLDAIEDQLLVGERYWHSHWPVGGGSLLHLAAADGHVALARALIDGGMNVTALSADGRTPREVAYDNHRNLWRPLPGKLQSNWAMVELLDAAVTAAKVGEGAKGQRAKDEL